MGEVTGRLHLNGAGEGKTGVNFVLRHTGQIDWLEGCAAMDVAAGDTFCIHTPGGGGWNSQSSS